MPEFISMQDSIYNTNKLILIILPHNLNFDSYGDEKYLISSDYKFFSQIIYNNFTDIYSKKQYNEFNIIC